VAALLQVALVAIMAVVGALRLAVTPTAAEVAVERFVLSGALAALVELHHSPQPMLALNFLEIT
jgi:hypothetical protein